MLDRGDGVHEGAPVWTDALELAHSVYEYVSRTAEAVPAGVRWRTLTVENAPQYVTNLYNGVAGIALFLADYHRLTRSARALDLARDALRWCADAGAPLRLDFPAIGTDASLGWGTAGVGLAWLRLAAATGDREFLRRAEAVAARLPDTAGLRRVTRLLFGDAGTGLFLVRLWEATQKDQHLAAAAETGAWLDRVATRDAQGCLWTNSAGGVGPPRLGLGTGAAGVGYFWLVLHEATGDRAWLERAREVASTLLAFSRPAGGVLGGVEWPWHTGTAESRCQWCMGEPGIGLFFLKAHQATHEPAFLAAAAAAGETTFAHGDLRANPGQCHGLAGNAELFLQLAGASGQQRWLERVRDFARRAAAYRVSAPGGEVWPVDEPDHFSPDLMCGGAGVGHFFLRLATPAGQAVRHPFA